MRTPIDNSDAQDLCDDMVYPAEREFIPKQIDFIPNLGFVRRFCRLSNATPVEPSGSAPDNNYENVKAFVPK
jgi:hypothetical protein